MSLLFRAILVLILYILLLLETLVHELGHAYMIRKCNKKEKLIIALGYQEQIIHKKNPFVDKLGIRVYSHKYILKFLKMENLNGLIVPEHEYSLQYYDVKQIRKIAKAGIMFGLTYVLVIGTCFIIIVINIFGMVNQNFAFWARIIVTPIFIIFVSLFCYSGYRNSSDYAIASSDEEAIKFSNEYKNKEAIYRYKNYVD
ncbi:hypothetical protein acsn021_09110 [Anaerocolumna cellulosilytica]|uniref:Uncharacterized protein n=1 Tax=Anaerocolumna cellulosilytica TaxID=433286 RepID=A0A6S6R1C4_9FIRM|nr:hypothetical protein [Anaerocolumna cellulosilytica]MBB5194397.1 membrane-associated protease RseP (regulator of RpoE activity) [Anaerocolumna cellulosilytica]BCJ93342.1 hypothetical protein acsn021_09110 [Anaerocolumna cellulosilytica]